MLIIRAIEFAFWYCQMLIFFLVTYSGGAEFYFSTWPLSAPSMASSFLVFASRRACSLPRALLCYFEIFPNFSLHSLRKNITRTIPIRLVTLISLPKFFSSLFLSIPFHSLQNLPQKPPLQPTNFTLKILNLLPTIQRPSVIQPEATDHFVPRVLDGFVAHDVFAHFTFGEFGLQGFDFFLDGFAA